MKAAARALLPDGLAGRFVLVLTAALLAANLVAVTLLALERDRLGLAAREEGALARVLAQAPLLDGVPSAERARRVTVGARRDVRLEVSPLPTVPPGAGGPRLRALAARLSAGLDDRALHLRERRRGGALLLSVELRAPDAWLNAVLPPGRRPRREGGPAALLAVVGLSLLSVLGVGVLFVRQMTRPLDALAEAARAAGRGDRAARVPERGAREVREAAAAFNDMQARIARFEAERTRTLAALGHDLRTPITSLRIRAEMLDAEDAAPMVRTLDEMAVMADGLVTFARGEGEAEAPEPVALADLLDAVCRDRGATLAATADAVVTGRPVALSRAVGNLIDNALRYGGAARVTLARDGVQAVVAVEDDGPGIPEDRLAAMFEPFVRGEASRSADTGGAGLGLSIVRQVAHAHDGTATLSNRPGGGLRATLRLPLARAAPGGADRST